MTEDVNIYIKFRATGVLQDCFSDHLILEANRFHLGYNYRLSRK